MQWRQVIPNNLWANTKGIRQQYKNQMTIFQLLCLLWYIFFQAAVQHKPALQHLQSSVHPERVNTPQHNVFCITTLATWKQILLEWMEQARCSLSEIWHKGLINTLTKKWNTKQFNCRARLQKGSSLHCVNTSIHLLVCSTGNLSSSPARLILREWKTWSSSAQAARTATATPPPGSASWSLTACPR